MSSLWVNIRIFYWHLQIGPDRPWIAMRWNQHMWKEGIGLHWFAFHQLPWVRR
jgi:hypothetical protein